MSPRDLAKYLSPLVLSLSLLGCGGGGADWKNIGDGSGGGGGGTTPTYRMGLLSNGSFSDGVLGVGVDNLSAGGSTQVDAYIVDQNGSVYSDAVEVKFSSSCTAQGTATMESPSTTVSARAQTTYVAKGCEGSDRITATATVGGQALSAAADLTVQGASVGSISFISATPDIIGLQGAGGEGRSETSTVIFRVLNSVGGPKSNADVAFALNTTAGGLSLSPTTAKSGSDGYVQTVVTSGTVVTSVRVTATVVGTGISTQSDALKVSSGLPDQDSFSLSAKVLNPEAWNIDGVRVPITIYLADHFNNRVADGTTVSFTTEGGSIDEAGSSCATVNGSCTVDWVSQNPRPADGRVTILASAIGEESFIDGNGNGRFDTGESFGLDLAEAFRDDNENGVLDLGAEPFSDFNNNGTFDTADGIYNGGLCASDNATCNGDVPRSLHIREKIVIVMSGSTAWVYDEVIGIGDTDANGDLDVTDGRAQISLDIRDVNQQIMPAGTTITATSSLGTVEVPTKYTVVNSSMAGPRYYSFDITINSTTTTTKTGTLVVEVKTPGGMTTYFKYGVIQYATP